MRLSALRAPRFDVLVKLMHYHLLRQRQLGMALRVLVLPPQNKIAIINSFRRLLNLTHIRQSLYLYSSWHTPILPLERR